MGIDINEPRPADLGWQTMRIAQLEQHLLTEGGRYVLPANAATKSQ
jgi:hypothetical protein